MSTSHRTKYLPFCLPLIGQEEIDEVIDTLRSGWLTTGPKVKRFEEDFAVYVGAEHAIAVNSCTSALLISLAAAGIGPGDEVIVPTLTFCATANVVSHVGATPVIVDVDQNFGISVEQTERAITERTRAIIPVHYAGQACDLNEITALADARGVSVIEDAAHAVGSEYGGAKIGSHGRTVCFSFYATKNMTTGEGGMITTNDQALATRMRQLSLHGISHDAWKRYSEAGSWYYEVVESGHKGNMMDIQAALGIHQLRRLDSFIRRRQEIAAAYDAAFSNMPELVVPTRLSNRNHVFHLYPIRLRLELLSVNRAEFIRQLNNANIGVSVHFIPLHRHPLYRDTYGYRPEQFPIAEALFDGLLSLPLYPAMTNSDVEDVIRAVREVSLLNRVIRAPNEKDADACGASEIQDGVTPTNAVRFAML